ncbi:glutaredoxin [Elasticomyces elasticus]|nr:glutaredoxin [Elasticomyces elasticus]
MNSSTPLSSHDPGPAVEDSAKKNSGSSQTPQTCTVTDIATEADFTSHTSSLPSTTLQVVYFHAPWAAPCKQMSAVLSALASTYTMETPPTVVFLSINAEEVSEVSEAYQVTQVPYIVLQKDGKTLDTISGGDASQVRAAVEKHAGKAQGNPGKLGLPPAQKVTKPIPTEPLDQSHSEGDTNGDTNGSTKNLSAYAPDSSDPATAPQYSSGEKNDATKEELHERLSELVKAAPVMLFMKGTPSAPQCGFSRQTVSVLREHGVRYGFFNILADDEVRQGLKEFAEWPTFPQVWVGGELVGGLDILKEEFENDAEFLKDYSVSGKGGPAGAKQQATPA